MVSPIGLRADVPLEPNSAPPPHLLARLDQLEADGLKQTDPAEHCREWRKIYVPRLLADPARFDDIRGDPCECPNEWPDHMMQAMAHIFLDLDEWDWRGQLSSVTAPTLVVYGLEDTMPLWAVKEWTDELPVARLVAMPAVGRMPWVERPEQFHSVVDTFLRGSWPAEAA
jgi:pimeloyl-ACP methyl ester carboxylesterase